jgi:hypothetical protein
MWRRGLKKMCATHWKRSRNLQLSFNFHGRLKNDSLKNFLLLVLLLGAATVLPSCKKTIEGSGNYVDEVRTVGLFSAIESDGDYDIVVTNDSTQMLTIHAEDNIIPEIETTVSGGILIIRNRNVKNVIHDNGVSITIAVPLIYSLNMQGSGSISCSESFNPLTATVNISGSGSIDYAVNCESITATISGSGSMSLAGTTINALHTISGSGDIHAFDFPSEKVQVNISGSGDCEVNVSQQLVATISGSGNVIYMGNPSIISTGISGSGTVHPQ